MNKIKLALAIILFSIPLQAYFTPLSRGDQVLITQLGNIVWLKEKDRNCIIFFARGTHNVPHIQYFVPEITCNELVFYMKDNMIIEDR